MPPALLAGCAPIARGAGATPGAMPGATVGLPILPARGGNRCRGERIAAGTAKFRFIDIPSTAFGAEHGVSFLSFSFDTLRLDPRQPNLLRNMSRRRKFPCEWRAPARVAPHSRRQNYPCLRCISTASVVQLASFSHRMRRTCRLCKFFSRTEKNLQLCRLWEGRNYPARRAARPIPEIWLPPLSRDLRLARLLVPAPYGHHSPWCGASKPLMQGSPL